MDNTKKTINILSMCTGYGGFELALERIFTRPMRVVAVEIEAFAAANLVAKAEQGKLAIEALYTDVKTFPSRKFRGCFDGIVAGYPCQPFSHAGKRKGKDDPRHLWPFIRHHISTIRPLFCIFENVAGHVTLGFDAVYRDLHALGYKVEAGLFTASEVGDSMEGTRLFILGQAESFNGDLLFCERRSRQTNINIRRTSEVLGEAEYIRLATTKNTASTDTSIQNNQKRANSPSEFKRANISRELSRFPAFRGQPQYNWEEPRTVESGMGRTVDGFASRVDELRLLGNGIVPDQAEKAIRYLFESAGIE